MSKRILALALVLLTLFALGCSKATKGENADVLKVDENDAMTIDMDKLTYFSFELVTLYQFADVFAQAFSYELLPSSSVDSTYIDTFAAHGITVMPYDISSMDGANKMSLLTYQTEQGIMLIELLCTDFEEDGREFLVLCLSVIKLCEPDLAQDDDAVMQLLKDILTSQKLTSESGITYQIEKTEENSVTLTILPKQ